jgi:hypothetical protein
MKLSIRYLRWVFLALYVLAILTLLALALLDASSWVSIAGILLLIVTELIFVFGAGTIELCKPIRRRRLMFPVTVAALMVAILAGAMSLALGELLRLDSQDWAAYVFWGIVFVNWVAWAVLFYFDCQGRKRFRVLKRLTLTILGGSLVSLLASVPSHIIVARRPGCLVGISTGLGISAGLCVMLWSFGPGIVLLFLRDRFQRELQKHKKA